MKPLFRLRRCPPIWGSLHQFHGVPSDVPIVELDAEESDAVLNQGAIGEGNDMVIDEPSPTEMPSPMEEALRSPWKADRSAAV